MTYDLIVISASRDKDLVLNTQQTIDSCIAEGDVNVILVETFQRHEYRGVDELLMYEGDFNYNRALNIGIKHRRSEIQILANNDIIFRPGWSKIGDVMRANDYLSASALSNDFRHDKLVRGKWAYEGYTIGYQLAGWCIFTDRQLWDKIGQLDERHNFWYSDNVYADQLIEKGIKHALICSVTVDHLGSRTLNKIDSRTRVMYTRNERISLNAKRETIRKGHTKDIPAKV